MIKKREFILVEGAFTPQDAREILTNLYNSKINFHMLKDFSSTERFGVHDETASKRIPELKNSIVAISEIVQDAAVKNKNLVIAATVNIQVEPDK